jgi:uncharacterized membrane protein YqaE (UPF0057 family)
MSQMKSVNDLLTTLLLKEAAMFRTLCYRTSITILNIFFPPLAVGFLDNFSTDCLVNSILFVCGVLPSHVHGFYISCVYFSRRHKVRRGIYPGGYKAFIYTDTILNGGVSNAEVRRLAEGDRTRRSRAKSPKA